MYYHERKKEFKFFVFFTLLGLNVELFFVLSTLLELNVASDREFETKLGFRHLLNDVTVNLFSIFQSYEILANVCELLLKILVLQSRCT